MKDLYEESEGIRWVTLLSMWAILTVFIALGFTLCVHLWYAWNPHDYDCSRHGGTIPAAQYSKAVVCLDGYQVY
jgi:hypothetical protein